MPNCKQIKINLPLLMSILINSKTELTGLMLSQMLQVALPAGDYELTLQLLPLPAERAGLTLSLLGLLLWSLWLARSVRHRNSHTSAANC